MGNPLTTLEVSIYSEDNLPIDNVFDTSGKRRICVETLLVNDDGTNIAQVNNDKELLVHDQHAIDVLDDILANTGVVATNITTGWEFFAISDKAFASTFSAQITGGAGEKDFFLLKNPVASGKVLRIKWLNFGARTAGSGIFRLYKKATITADGTVNPIVNYRDTAITGNATAFSSPTTSARGNKFLVYDLNPGGTGTIRIDQELALIILEGETLLITIEQSANNNSYSMNISWGEETII